MSTRLAPRVNTIGRRAILRRGRGERRRDIVRAVPDDERTRRRVSDATKGRIADLASGWSVDADEPPAAPDRARPKTLPPPPPGSKARSALENAILGADGADGGAEVGTSNSTTDEDMDALLPMLGGHATSVGARPRTNPVTTPPPLPPGAVGLRASPMRSGGVPTPASDQRSGLRARQTGGLATSAALSTAEHRHDESGVVIAPAPKGFAPRDDESGVVVAAAPRGFIPRDDESGVVVAPAPKGFIPRDDESGVVATPSRAKRKQAARVEASRDVAPRTAHVTSSQPIAPRTAPVTSSRAIASRTAPVMIAPPIASVLTAPPIAPAPLSPVALLEPPPTVAGVAPPSSPSDETEPILLEDFLDEDDVRGDPTSIDSSTTKFERGDPTNMSRDDISVVPSRARAGRLRTIAALRRQRGIFGDVRYVATAMFGIRRTRRELLELEVAQALRQAERDRYLVTLGRTAVISDGFDHPALGPTRDKLGEIEDERARHHAQVGAADEELQRVMHDREAHAKQSTIDLSAVEAELAELTKRLEPLNKEQAGATRKAADLRGELRRLDKVIADTTASLVSVKTGKKDPAEIQAELATLKADRIATQRDEPKIAAELDSLSPKIAALDAKKSESTKKRADLVKAEAADKHRAEELLAAIGAKRKVMDRAATDAEAMRDKILFELAERLYVDRPPELSAQLAPIDAIDVELGGADRRVMELREILSSVDRWKLWRGIAIIVVVLAITGTFGGWLYSMLG